MGIIILQKYDYLQYTQEALNLQFPDAMLVTRIFWSNSLMEGDYRGWQAIAYHPPVPTGKEEYAYRKGGGPATEVIKTNLTERLPKTAVESLARALLPQMRAYFASDEGQAALKQWRAEREHQG